MQCPSCGGKLAVAGNALSLKCEHCGTEHMIRREAGGIVLESYARCPVCNRNDRAEKVTAILSSQTHTSQGVTYQNRPLVVKDEGRLNCNRQVAVPIRTSRSSIGQASGLSAEPVNPLAETTWRRVASLASSLVGVGILGIPLSGCCVSVFTNRQSLWLAIPMLMRVLKCHRVSGGNSSVRLCSSPLPPNGKSQSCRQDRLEINKQLDSWNEMMKRWNRLYYCGRDDCVFVPGTNTYAPAAQMNKYLYRS